MACCFRQSRKCSDGTLSGLWLPTAKIPDTNTIGQGGLCYYFDLSDAPSILCLPSGGTLHSGYVTVLSCSTSDCAPGNDCNPCSGFPVSVWGGVYTAPNVVRVDLSSIIICTACVDAPTVGSSTKATGSLGVYDLRQTNLPGFNCTYSIDCQAFACTVWVGSDTCDDATATQIKKTYRFHIDAFPGTSHGQIFWQVHAYTYGTSSDDTICPTALPRGANWPGGDIFLGNSTVGEPDCFSGAVILTPATLYGPCASTSIGIGPPAVLDNVTTPFCTIEPLF